MALHQPPPLFGRLTMVLNDHRQLEVTLVSLRRMCVQVESGGGGPASELDPAALIGSLIQSLSAHFAVEESPGYFGTVVSDRPALAEAVAELTAEHSEMLVTLRALHAVSASEASWQELPVPLLELVDRLERHERAETRLMREFFESDD